MIAVPPTDIRIVLAGHGSRDAHGVEEFESFAAMFRNICGSVPVEHGYLEFQSPTISEAVASASSRGSGPIIVVPVLLAAATHAKNDMPSLLHDLRNEYPNEDIRFAAVMDIHATLLDVCRRRIVEAEATGMCEVKRSQSCLVVVGRGTTDPDANGDIAKLARMLQEGMGFEASFVCYSGTAKPLVYDGIKAAAKLGHKRIVVLPYFLFNGVLVKRIYAAADDVQKLAPQVEVVKAKYLGTDEDVVAVLLERALQAVHGEPKMNCSLCKYRTPIVGYEKEVGLPQTVHTTLNQLKALPAVLSKGRLDSLQQPYKPHPIESESFQIIKSSIDWSPYACEEQPVLQRLVHTTGDFECIKDVFFSPGAVATGVRALLRCRRVITDVTMVQTGLRRSLLADLQIETCCSVHDAETAILAERHNLTRSAAGIRSAWQKFGNDVVIAIGDAPTAVMETVRLIKENGFRPQLVVALPVGFVGTRECKEALKSCIQVPRITNSGTRGGSPWAAAVINAMLIEASNVAKRGSEVCLS